MWLPAALMKEQPRGFPHIKFVEATEEIRFITRGIHNKQQSHVLKSPLPYHLESKTHIYHASRVWSSLLAVAEPLKMKMNKRLFFLWKA